MATLQEIQNIFKQFGVPVASSNESPEQRLNRILNEVNSGARTLQGVTNSVQGIAQREGWQPNPHQAQIDNMQQRLDQLTGPVDQTQARFDPVAAAGYRGLDRQLADLQAGTQFRLGNLLEDRTRSVADTERMNSEALEALQARMADQGILRSGINVAARNNQNQNYLRAVDQIQNLYQRGVTGAELERTSGVNNLNSQRELIQAQAAQQEAQQRVMEEQRRAQTSAQLRSSIDQLTQMGQTGRGPGQANDITAQVRSMFQTNGVPIAAGGENESQRLARITQEVQAGRPLSGVLASIQGIARQQPQQQTQARPGMGSIPIGQTPTFGTYRPYGT